MSTRNQLQRALDASLAAAPIFRRIIVLDEVGSTQDEAKALCGAEGLIIAALRQTKGRGTRGRIWEDTQHHGLAITFALPRSTADQGMLSLTAGVAAAYTCRAATAEHAIHRSIGLKWPNDIVCEKDSVLHKLGGILIEVHESCPLIGIGINISHAPSDFPPGLSTNPTSLLQLGSTESRAKVANRLTRALAYTLGRKETDVLDVWKNFDKLTGRHARLTHDNTIHEGIVESIDPLNELRIRTAEGSVVTLPARSTSLVKD